MLKDKFMSINYAPNITTPIIIFHGKKDKIVKYEEVLNYIILLMLRKNLFQMIIFIKLLKSTNIKAKIIELVTKNGPRFNEKIDTVFFQIKDFHEAKNFYVVN